MQFPSRLLKEISFLQTVAGCFFEHSQLGCFRLSEGQTNVHRSAQEMRILREGVDLDDNEKG